jgi:hypothetical protein
LKGEQKKVKNKIREKQKMLKTVIFDRTNSTRQEAIQKLIIEIRNLSNELEILQYGKRSLPPSKLDKNLSDIQKKYLRKDDVFLVCPKCGNNNNNTFNGKPWCFKCGKELESKLSYQKSIHSIKLVKHKYPKNLTFVEIKK